MINLNMQIQSVFWIYQRFILTVGRLYHHLTCIRNFCLSLYRDWRMTDLDSNFYWVRVPSMCLLVISSSNSREGNGIPLQCSCLENPRDGEPGGLLSLGLHRVRHDWSNLAAATEMVLTKIYLSNASVIEKNHRTFLTPLWVLTSPLC